MFMDIKLYASFFFRKMENHLILRYFLNVDKILILEERQHICDEKKTALTTEVILQKLLERNSLK